MAGKPGGSVGFLDQRYQRRSPACRVKLPSSLVNLRCDVVQFRQSCLTPPEVCGLCVSIPEFDQPGLSDVILTATLFELSCRLVQLALQIRQRRVGDAVILFTQAFVQRIQFVLLPGGCGLGCLPHTLIHVEPKQRAQHLAALTRFCLQEPRELALRKNHRLGERIHVEPEQASHLLRCRAHLVGNRLG